MSIFLLTQKKNCVKLNIEKVLPIDGQPPKHIVYKEVTACFLRTGRLLLCIYKSNNQGNNYA